MQFFTSSLYAEVNCFFSVSYKIDIEIEKALNKQISSELRLPPKEEGFEYISLMVSTSSKTVEVEAKGPGLDKKEEIITWALWLPYDEITSAPSQEVPYIKFYFDAIVLLLERYGIEEKSLRAIQHEIEQKVIGNSEFDYVDNKIKYDLTDFDF
ncbi:hypothetical protein AB5N96_08075 [Chryseomicrobium imtechense]